MIFYHTFSTMALEAGMDVKTLSALLGHVSSATTLDIYTHITDDMQRNAATHIDRGSAKQNHWHNLNKVQLWNHSHILHSSPYHGKKRSRDVYGKTREECEEKLAALIVQMKAEIKTIKDGEAGADPQRCQQEKTGGLGLYAGPPQCHQQKQNRQRSRCRQEHSTPPLRQYSERNRSCKAVIQCAKMHR